MRGTFEVFLGPGSDSGLSGLYQSDTRQVCFQGTFRARLGHFGGSFRALRGLLGGTFEEAGSNSGLSGRDQQDTKRFT